ncbi:MAG: hypothetical protein ACWA5A_09380 [Marinibacterium sp.]
MMKLSVAAGLLFLSACSYSVPVAGTLGREAMQGQATAALSGGTFWVVSPGGLRCDGTYDALDSNPTIQAPVSCNDGRQGILVISRTTDMTSGTVIGKLDDGTEGRFVFGNLQYGQAFGGTTARTQ